MIPHRVELSRTTIAEETVALATHIDEHYRRYPKPLHLLAVLYGATYFASDLSRALSTPHTLGFIRTSTYHDERSPHPITSVHPVEPLKYNNHHLLIVEDIVDTGQTADALAHYLRSIPSYHQPLSLGIASALTRASTPTTWATLYEPRFAMHTLLHDRFVFGYGMDLGGQYRHLPYLASPIP